ncbi:MAG: hypothetical protein IJ055_06375 [Oscillospiraceae bacterium]|nr:hypothetical protein [Oscillospiraceae bacterium]
MIALHHADMAEAFRYMGHRGTPDAALLEKAGRCEEKLLQQSVPRYLYRVQPIAFTPKGIAVEHTALLLPGEDIRAHLSGCDRVIVMCATLSVGADAAIRQAQAHDVLEGLMTDAIASALTEQLCDAAEAEILAALPGLHATWRFSPGYGDLPLSVQGALLDALGAGKHLGVTLSGSGMLIPTKSVTALIGLSPHSIPKGKRGCAVCSMREQCTYRKKGEHC